VSIADVLGSRNRFKPTGIKIIRYVVFREKCFFCHCWWWWCRRHFKDFWFVGGV